MKVRKSIIIYGLLSVIITILCLNLIDKSVNDTNFISVLENNTTTVDYDVALDSFYSSLDDPNKNLLETNKFNCSKYGCVGSSLYNIGFLSDYEYENIGGDRSYLFNYSDYFIMSNGSIKTLNGKTSGGVRPVVYLNNEVKITGSGTINDPYRISEYQDINFIAYTYNGEKTNEKYSNLIKSKVIKNINCENGTSAYYDYDENVIKFKDTHAPDYCTIDFTDGIEVNLNVVNGSISNSKRLAVNGEVSYKVNPNKGYALKGSSVSCDKEAVITLTSNGVKISNVKNAQVCKISLVKTSPFEEGTLAEKILLDNPTVISRSNFDVFNSSIDQPNTIYATNTTEDGSTVYYYSGNNSINNWVKFGKEDTEARCTYEKEEVFYDSKRITTESACTSKTVCLINHNFPAHYDYKCSGFGYTDTNKKPTWVSSKTNQDTYWRIIRTNEDGSIRLLYVGPDPETKMGYIGESQYNVSDENEKYTSELYYGYMYGTTSNFRTNTNSSTIKTYLDNWYKSNILGKGYDKYVSKTAIYCNDRTTASSNSVNVVKGASSRVNMPSYKCGSNGTGGLFESTQSIADKFSVSTSSLGNGNLSYPIGLVTADEIAFAGGQNYSTNSDGYTVNNNGKLYYFTNSKGESVIGGSKSWWTMSPSNRNTTASVNPVYMFTVTSVYVNQYTGTNYGVLSTGATYGTAKVRPVISLKACVKFKSGDGTSTNPYEVTIDDNCAKSEN